MSTPIPMPLRAAAGLAAIAIDSARKLPSQLVGLPVLAVSTALQASLKAQQRYAELAARGDQLLGHLRSPTEGTPAWARFDDEPVPGTPVSAGAAAGVGWATGAAGRPLSAFDAVPDPADAGEAVDVGGPLDEEAADVLGLAEEAADLAEAELSDVDPEGNVVGVAVVDADLADADLADADLADAGVADPALADAELADAVLGGPLEDAQSAAAGPADADLADEELADEELAESDPAGPGAEAAMTGAVGTRPGSARPAPAEGGEPKDAELSAAAVADAAITGAGRPDLEPADFGADAEAVTEALSEAADSPPLPRYDELSIPQLRGRLRTLDETTLEQLVGYERVHAARAPYLTMLENRLTTLRSR